MSIGRSRPKKTSPDLFSINDIELALVSISHVPSLQPSIIVEGFSGGFEVVEVALHDGGSSDIDLSLYIILVDSITVLRDQSVGLLSDIRTSVAGNSLCLHAIQQSSDAATTVPLRPQECSDPSGLRHAPDLIYTRRLIKQSIHLLLSHLSL